MANTPEGRVKDKVKALLKAMGIWYYMPMQNGYGVVGIPDFICCWKGRFMVIETKAPGKVTNTTANQKRVLGQIDAALGLTLVVDSVDELESFLKRNGEW